MTFPTSFKLDYKLELKGRELTLKSEPFAQVSDDRKHGSKSCPATGNNAIFLSS